MFGHQDDNTTPADAVDASGSDTPAEDNGAATASVNPVISASAAPTPSAALDQSWQHPGAPINNTSNDTPDAPSSSNDQEEKIEDVISPAGGFPKKPSYDYASGDTSAPAGADSELVDIKRQALTELAPLVDKLDQPAEEKFRTLMMMIQASDDQSLVKAAFAAAHSITDEKARAKALLDIVNEINYFTQQPPVA